MRNETAKARGSGIFRIFLAPLSVLAFSASAEELPVNPDVTPATIYETICMRGWTRTVRPPKSYTNRIKLRLVELHGLPRRMVRAFELDHRIPLALGGAPADPRNLILQPWDEASDKDDVEACLANAVCGGRISLGQARRRIWRDWREAANACEIFPRRRWRY